MKSMITILSFLFLTLSSVAAEKDCDIKIQGGVDNWPWASAQPFPWGNIQGIWKLNTDSEDTYFKIRVGISDPKHKVLNITKIVDGDCANPVAKGVGFVDHDAKNVIHAVIVDDELRYQLTLAMFNTKDLSSEMLSSDTKCGSTKVLAASAQVIGRTGKLAAPLTETMPTEKMLLKKISNSLDSICKKPIGR